MRRVTPPRPAVTGVLLAGALLLGACGAAGPTPTTAPTATTAAARAVATTAAPTAPAPRATEGAGGAGAAPTPVGNVAPPAGPLPKVGGTATGQRYSVTLHQLVDPATIPSQGEAGLGDRWVTAEVTIANTGGGDVDFRRSAFFVRTADERSRVSEIGGQQPYLDRGKLAPGQNKRGWVTFRVPTGAQLVTLLYNPTDDAGRSTGDPLFFDIKK